MQKKSLVLPFIVLCYWTEAAPVNLGTLEFDNLETNLDDLKYEVEEEDLDDYYDSLDNGGTNEQSDNQSANDQTKVNSSGFKKKATTKKGGTAKQNIQDLKKFLKAIGIIDKGSYSDNEIYALVEGLAAEAVGVKGNEDRKYKKGTKTRGFHKVYHKDEYKKNKEFYEDDETSGSIKKAGGKAAGFRIGAGAGFDKGNFKHDHRKGIFGKQGYLNKGFVNKEYSGYSDDQGFEEMFNNGS